MRTRASSEIVARRSSAALCLTLVVAFVCGVWWQTGGLEVWTFEGRRQLQVAAGSLQAPAVALRDADGSEDAAPWRAHDTSSRAYLVDFIYTRCPGVCRALGNQYQQMQRELLTSAQHDPAYDRVQLLSVSFDVAHDGVPQLHEAAMRLGAQPRRWRFVVPASDAGSRTLLRALGVVAIPDGTGGFVHNGDIHLLDGQGRLRALFGFDEWRQALVAARVLAAQ